MVQEKKEEIATTVEVKEEVVQEGGTSKFLDLVAKVIAILENIPKALAGFLLILSLFGGATGVYGALTTPDADIAKRNTSQLSEMEKRIYTLEVEKRLLNQIVIRMMANQGLLEENVELTSFIIDVDSGKVTEISEK